jgi:NADP-reducing hydrogenase subunit HndB
MNKIRSFADLKMIREEMKSGLLHYAGDSTADRPVRVKVAMATCGIASGARETMDFLRDALEKRGVNATVSPVGCMGYCYAEPTIEVELPGEEAVVFGEVNREKADLIIERYIKGGELVDGIIPVNYQTID